VTVAGMFVAGGGFLACGEAAGKESAQVVVIRAGNTALNVYFPMDSATLGGQAVSTSVHVAPGKSKRFILIYRPSVLSVTVTSSSGDSMFNLVFTRSGG
jgi:hypothetical protein